jgi:hypothetical protein
VKAIADVSDAQRPRVSPVNLAALASGIDRANVEASNLFVSGKSVQARATRNLEILGRFPRSGLSKPSFANLATDREQTSGDYRRPNHSVFGLNVAGAARHCVIKLTAIDGSVCPPVFSKRTLSSYIVRGLLNRVVRARIGSFGLPTPD